MTDETVRRLLIAVPVLLLAAGCGGDSIPPSATPPPPTTAATTQAAADPVSPPAPTTSAPLSAADGRNLKACADGVCEVMVKTGDSLPNTSGAGPVRIAVRDGMIVISHGSAGGMTSSLSGYPGMPQQINDQVFLIVAVQGDTGVLRLSRV